jgi:hypothetical protein
VVDYIENVVVGQTQLESRQALGGSGTRGIPRQYNMFKSERKSPTTCRYMCGIKSTPSGSGRDPRVLMKNVVITSGRMGVGTKGGGSVQPTSKWKSE